jgi:hypothetical protein
LQREKKELKEGKGKNTENKGIKEEINEKETNQSLY